MLRYGEVWWGGVLCGVVGWGAVWCGLVRCGLALHGVAWNGGDRIAAEMNDVT